MVKHWCMCTELGSVLRDGWSTCSKCGGQDAYGRSPQRPVNMRKKIVSGAPNVPSDEQLDKIEEVLDKAQEVGLDVLQGHVPLPSEARFQQLLRECGHPDWNSYTAEPLNVESVNLARKLFPAVAALSRSGAVAITPCVSGGITFEGVTPEGNDFEIQVWAEPLGPTGSPRL